MQYTWISRAFSLAAFKYLSLSLVFRNLIMMFLVPSTSWICMGMCFDKCGKFQLLFEYISKLTLFLPSPRTLMTQTLGILLQFHRSCNLCLFSPVYFLLVVELISIMLYYSLLIFFIHPSILLSANPLRFSSLLFYFSVLKIPSVFCVYVLLLCWDVLFLCRGFFYFFTCSKHVCNCSLKAF